MACRDAAAAVSSARLPSCAPPAAFLPSPVCVVLLHSTFPLHRLTPRHPLRAPPACTNTGAALQFPLLFADRSQRHRTRATPAPLPSSPSPPQKDHHNSLLLLRVVFASVLVFVTRHCLRLHATERESKKESSSTRRRVGVSRLRSSLALRARHSRVTRAVGKTAHTPPRCLSVRFIFPVFTNTHSYLYTPQQRTRWRSFVLLPHSPFSHLLFRHHATSRFVRRPSPTCTRLHHTSTALQRLQRPDVLGLKTPSAPCQPRSTLRDALRRRERGELIRSSPLSPPPVSAYPPNPQPPPLATLASPLFFVVAAFTPTHVTRSLSAHSRAPVHATASPVHQPAPAGKRRATGKEKQPARAAAALSFLFLSDVADTWARFSLPFLAPPLPPSHASAGLAPLLR